MGSLSSIRKMAAAFGIAVGLFFAQGVAAQEWDCGETPGSVTATLSGGTLTISGTGKMGSYMIGDAIVPGPWQEFANSITSVVIGEGVTSIRGHAFIGCTVLTSVTIPESVTSIEDNAFGGCNALTSIVIPKATIGYEAFTSCTALKTVTLGDGVVSIKKMAFYNCQGLTSIISLNADPPTIDDDLYGNTFHGVNKASVCIYVPNSSIDAYKAAAGWNAFECVRDASDYVSVAANARELPATGPVRRVAVVAPVAPQSSGLTAGPNPAAVAGGGILFFWQGAAIVNATLYVYDATGNVVKKISVSDKFVGAGVQSKRVVGSWDLRDDSGRVVSKGAYLVRGAIAARGGKRETVSVAVGVR